MKIIITALMLASLSTVSANIIFTLEAAGVQQTSLTNTVTANFNSLTQGLLGTYVSPIGVYSGGAAIAPRVGSLDDAQFGGAYGSQYISAGKQSGLLNYTLTFFSPQNYFGLDWTGADGSNLIQFYNGSTLLATFNSFNIQAALPPSYVDYILYFGNPNDGSDPLEPFFYVNFRSNDPSTNFTSIRFSNFDTTTGFESDNHSIQLPEPSSVSLLLVGLGILGITQLSRSSSKFLLTLARVRRAG